MVFMAILKAKFCRFVRFIPGWFSVVRGMLHRNAAAEMNKMQQ